jgi:hypothetical protein
MTSDQFHVLHDQFFITRDQINMTSDQFEKADDQNWSQNQLVRLVMIRLVTKATRPENSAKF